MEGEELRAGKARVLEHLIDPLNAIGMVRKKGMTLETHKSVLDSIAARLAYMETNFLQALAEVVEAHAVGPDKDQWPSVTNITGWARSLQQPPASESRLVRSFLQSAPGRRAVDGGYIVELRKFLKKHGCPPSDFNMTHIRNEADENSRQRMRIKENINVGRATDQERQWLDAWQKAEDTCMVIISAKSKGVAA